MFDKYIDESKFIRNYFILNNEVILDVYIS